MSRKPSSTRLFGLLRRRAKAAADPADLGTAYGLDLSLLPEDADAASRPPAKPARSSGWWVLLRRARRT